LQFPSKPLLRLQLILTGYMRVSVAIRRICWTRGRPKTRWEAGER
jgi:hypothetical protein